MKILQKAPKAVSVQEQSQKVGGSIHTSLSLHIRMLLEACEPHVIHQSLTVCVLSLESMYLCVWIMRRVVKKCFDCLVGVEKLYISTSGSVLQKTDVLMVEILIINNNSVSRLKRPYFLKYYYNLNNVFILI